MAHDHSFAESRYPKWQKKLCKITFVLPLSQPPRIRTIKVRSKYLKMLASYALVFYATIKLQSNDNISALKEMIDPT